MKPPKKPRATVSMYKTFATMAYHHPEIAEKGIVGTGFFMDRDLSTNETKVFVNPNTRKIVLAFRGTALNDKKTRFKDIISDFNIFKGSEKKDRRFKEALRDFDRVHQKYQPKGFTVDTTGHSLGGQLATHVNRERSGLVSENLSFSRGTGLREPFRKRPENTWDYSHKGDIISLGARLSEGGGGNVVDRSIALNPHSLKELHIPHSKETTVKHFYPKATPENSAMM